MKNFKDVLIDSRIKAGLTQKQLAYALGYTNPQYVSNWECGKCGIPIKKIKKVSQLLKLDQKTIKELIALYRIERVKSTMGIK